MPTQQSTQQDLDGIGTHLYTQCAQGCTARHEEKTRRASIGARSTQQGTERKGEVPEADDDMGVVLGEESDTSTGESSYSEVELPVDLPAGRTCLLPLSTPGEWTNQGPSYSRVAELGKCRRRNRNHRPIPRSVPASELTRSGITDPTANDLIDKPEFGPTVLSAHPTANAAPTPGCTDYKDLPSESKRKEGSITWSQLSGPKVPESLAWGEWELGTDRHSEGQRSTGDAAEDSTDERLSSNSQHLRPHSDVGGSFIQVDSNPVSDAGNDTYDLVPQQWKGHHLFRT